ncbi:hypothetical protein SGPA1_40869 [Streptomyces misionensis JCM 4497]
MAGGPHQRRRLDDQPGCQWADRQRQQRHHVRPGGRALPEVPDHLERQRRPHVLLPERDPLRRARPVQLDHQRRGPRLRLLQGRELGHLPRGVGCGCLRLPPRQPLRRPRPRHRGAHHVSGEVPQHGHHGPGRRRHHQPHHRQHRQPGNPQQQRGVPGELSVGPATDPTAHRVQLVRALRG